jgi:outer membrane protein OmpA-like peptidoglycan-associated protein
MDIVDPPVGAYGNRLQPGIDHVLGEANEEGGILTARPPVGPGDWFIVVSEKPLPEPRAMASGNAAWMADGQTSLEVARDLAQAIRSGAFGAVVSRHLRFEVTYRDGARDYTAEQIAQYFGETTRNIERPRLDLYVNFEFNSADITSDSRQALDTWGRALSDPLLVEQRFAINGHTDDVGGEDYNQSLSERRAAAIRDVLIARYGIPAARLEVRGYGKSRPLLEGSSEAERTLNRRVDFERISRH